MIHPTAVISPRAELDSQVDVGPYAVIEENVKIGAGTKVYAHAFVTGHTQIGRDCQIHIGAVVGHLPQDLKFSLDTRSYLKIGDRTVIREYCTLHRGTAPESSTVIGDDNFLMGGVHVAHNCVLGSKNILCNYTVLGGHTVIGDQTFLSGAVLIHQFMHVGRLAMLSGGAQATLDIPPFVILYGRNEVRSINIVGLQRAGVTEESIREIKKVFRIFYRSDLNIKQAIERSESKGFQSSEVQEFIAFVKNSPNGIPSHRSG